MHNNIEKDLLRRAMNDGLATAGEDLLVDTYLTNGQQVLSLARPVHIVCFEVLESVGEIQDQQV